MPLKLGPFRFTYTQREQGQRTVIEHMINTYGIEGARVRISDEAMRAGWAYDILSPQHEWWMEIRTELLSMIRSHDWGKKVGIR